MQRFCCSVNDLLLFKDLHNGWSDGARDGQMRCLRYLNESANSRTTWRNLVCHKLPFVSMNMLSLTQSFVSL